MVVRKFEGERTVEMLEGLTAFILRVDGKPYGFSIGHLVSP